MTDYNDRRSIGIGVSIDTTSIPFRYPFFKSTADTDPILSIAIGDTIGTDSATDINNPGQWLATLRALQKRAPKGVYYSKAFFFIFFMCTYRQQRTT
jgi:hypothetical protein